MRNNYSFVGGDIFNVKFYKVSHNYDNFDTLIIIFSIISLLITYNEKCIEVE